MATHADPTDTRIRIGLDAQQDLTVAGYDYREATSLTSAYIEAVKRLAAHVGLDDVEVVPTSYGSAHEAECVTEHTLPDGTTVEGALWQAAHDAIVRDDATGTWRDRASVVTLRASEVEAIRDALCPVLYRVTASLDRDGQILDLSQAEVLGECYGVVYRTRAAAEAAAQDCRDLLDETDLDPATEYSVVQD